MFSSVCYLLGFMSFTAGVMITVVGTRIKDTNRSNSEFLIRMHPSVARVPIDNGSWVP